MKIDRLISIGFALVLAFLLTLAAAGAANAGHRRDDPATRAWAAKTIVNRALLEDVTAPERREYWNGTQCAGDLHDVSRRLRRRICFVWTLGFMGDTGRNSAYPTFEPHAIVTRGQAASIMWRLGTYGEWAPADHAATFIDVNRKSPHAEAIRWAALVGVVEGFDTTPATFRPDAPVTRRQFRKMLERVKVYWATDGQEVQR